MNNSDIEDEFNRLYELSTEACVRHIRDIVKGASRQKLSIVAAGEGSYNKMEISFFDILLVRLRGRANIVHETSIDSVDSGMKDAYRKSPGTGMNNSTRELDYSDLDSYHAWLGSALKAAESDLSGTNAMSTTTAIILNEMFKGVFALLGIKKITTTTNTNIASKIEELVNKKIPPIQPIKIRSSDTKASTRNGLINIGNVNNYFSNGKQSADSQLRYGDVRIDLGTYLSMSNSSSSVNKPDFRYILVMLSEIAAEDTFRVGEISLEGKNTEEAIDIISNQFDKSLKVTLDKSTSDKLVSTSGDATLNQADGYFYAKKTADGKFVRLFGSEQATTKVNMLSSIGGGEGSVIYLMITPFFDPCVFSTQEQINNYFDMLVKSTSNPKFLNLSDKALSTIGHMIGMIRASKTIDPALYQNPLVDEEVGRLETESPLTRRAKGKTSVKQTGATISANEKYYNDLFETGMLNARAKTVFDNVNAWIKLNPSEITNSVFAEFTVMAIGEEQAVKNKILSSDKPDIIDNVQNWFDKMWKPQDQFNWRVADFYASFDNFIDILRMCESAKSASISGKAMVPIMVSAGFSPLAAKYFADYVMRMKGSITGMRFKTDLVYDSPQKLKENRIRKAIKKIINEGSIPGSAFDPKDWNERCEGQKKTAIKALGGGSRSKPVVNFSTFGKDATDAEDLEKYKVFYDRSTKISKEEDKKEDKKEAKLSQREIVEQRLGELNKSDDPSYNPTMAVWIKDKKEDTRFRAWMNTTNPVAAKDLTKGEGYTDIDAEVKKKADKAFANKDKTLRKNTGNSKVANTYVEVAWEMYGKDYVGDVEVRKEYNVKYIADNKSTFTGDFDDEAEAVTISPPPSDEPVSKTQIMININENEAERMYGRTGTFLRGTVVISPQERITNDDPDSGSSVATTTNESRVRKLLRLIKEETKGKGQAGKAKSKGKGQAGKVKEKKTVQQRATVQQIAKEEEIEHTDIDYSKYTEDDRARDYALLQKHNGHNETLDNQAIALYAGTRLAMYASWKAKQSKTGDKNDEQSDDLPIETIASNLEATSSTTSDLVISLGNTEDTEEKDQITSKITATIDEVQNDLEAVSAQNNVNDTSKDTDKSNIDNINEIVDMLGNTAWGAFASFDKPNEILYVVCLQDESGNESSIKGYAHSRSGKEFIVGSTKVDALYTEFPGSGKKFIDVAYDEIIRPAFVDSNTKVKGLKIKTNAEGKIIGDNDGTSKDDLGTLNYEKFSKIVSSGEFYDETLRADIKKMNALLKKGGRPINVGKELVNAVGTVKLIGNEKYFRNAVGKKFKEYTEIIDNLYAMFKAVLNPGESVDFEIVERLGKGRGYKIVSKNIKALKTLENNKDNIPGLLTKLILDAKKIYRSTGTDKNDKDLGSFAKGGATIAIPMSTETAFMLMNKSNTHDLSNIGLASNMDIEKSGKMMPKLTQDQFYALAAYYEAGSVDDDSALLKRFKKRRTAKGINVQVDYPAYVQKWNDLEAHFKNRVLKDGEKIKLYTDEKVALDNSTEFPTSKNTDLLISTEANQTVDSRNLPGKKDASLAPKGRKVGFTYVHYPGHSVSSVYDKIVVPIINKGSGGMSYGAGSVDPLVTNMPTVKEALLRKIYIRNKFKEHIKNRVKEKINEAAANYEKPSVKKTGLDAMLKGMRGTGRKPTKLVSRDIGIEDRTVAKRKGRKRTQTQTQTQKQDPKKNNDKALGIAGFEWVENMPLDKILVTSAYGVYRGKDENGDDKYHGGIDFRAAIGTSVKTVAGGQISLVSIENENTTGTGGMYVKVDHGDGNSTKYFHLSSISVNKGDEVRAGQEIGESGDTGAPGEPHLHFEMVNGETTKRFWNAGKAGWPKK